MKQLLKNKEYMLLFSGRLTTNVGDSLYLIGAMWLAFELTGSSFYVGVVGFLTRAPTALQFLFGPLADRWNLKRIFVSTQLVQGVVVLFVPIAGVLNMLSIWTLLVVVLVVSVTNQIARPAFSATLPLIVKEENLTPANSLFSTAAQGFNAVFNGVSGLVISVTGAVVLFVIDSITFFIALILLGMITIPVLDDEDDEEDEPDYFRELRAGFDYLRGSLVLRIIVAATMANFGYGAVLATLPEFASSLGGSTTYGLLMGAVSGGSFVGSLLALKIDDVPYGWFLVVGYLITAVSIFLALVVTGPLLTASFFFFASISLGVYAVLTMSMMQSVIDNQLLGRVMSLSQSMYDVMVPVGSIIGGAVAATFAPTTTFYLLALLYAINFVYFLVHPELRSLPKIQSMDEEVLDLGSSR